MKEKKLFCSWSGGKDSCLSLYHALKTNQILCLITGMTETGLISRSHGVSLSVLRMQASLLNIPLLVFNSSWDDYEYNYKKTLYSLKKYNLSGGVFGDIDNIEHKQWVQNLCNSQNLEACLPLWERNREAILSEFLELGFKAKVISVNEKYLSKDFLGRDLTKEMISEFRERNMDICGENGEYHTIVYDGPLFSQKLSIKDGEIQFRSGYFVLDLVLLE